MHSTLVPEQHGFVLSRALRDMEAKQHSIKSLKSYPETGGRSLAAAAAAAAGGDVGGGGGGGGVGCRAGAAELEMEAKIQKAVEFKLEGHRCYKEKKFREAIGKYHRALLQLKGVHVAEGTTGSEVNLLNQAAAKLTEEQQRAVESTEIECYDSLTGESAQQRRPSSSGAVPCLLLLLFGECRALRSRTPARVPPLCHCSFQQIGVSSECRPILLYKFHLPLRRDT
ncbi:hypothetical protein Z043_120395 [Scleropages formosus]|uniref:Tetratricopeptide repeat protein 9B-like n=1 Tax=Scleropages formosus TaxID=113540 RepID=A0A0P7UJL1_SCLFO|nr:hypothetical protein Z043_120395 [Scleropages formosus]